MSAEHHIPTDHAGITALLDARLPGTGTHHRALPLVARVMMSGVAPLLVGPAGCGKSRLVHQIAALLQRPFGYARAVRDEFSLIGYRDATGALVRTAFREAFEHGHVFLLDEVDAGDPTALLAFNEALANGRCDFPDGVITAHPCFRVVAAANTFGTGRDRQYVGRNQLDATTLDRFVPLEVDYDRELERAMDAPADWVRLVHDARDAVQRLGLRHIVSTRAVKDGALMLRAGLDQEFVTRGALWRGLPPDQAERVTATVAEIAAERDIAASVDDHSDEDDPESSVDGVRVSITMSDGVLVRCIDDVVVKPRELVLVVEGHPSVAYANLLGVVVSHAVTRPSDAVRYVRRLNREIVASALASLEDCRVLTIDVRAKLRDRPEPIQGSLDMVTSTTIVVNQIAYPLTKVQSILITGGTGDHTVTTSAELRHAIGLGRGIIRVNIGPYERSRGLDEIAEISISRSPVFGLAIGKTSRTRDGVPDGWIPQDKPRRRTR